MKTIQELSNPDIIEINGEEYQVIEHTSQWMDFDKDELTMIVNLVKVGSGVISATHFLSYINERPNDRMEWKFNEYVKWEPAPIGIKNVNFNPKP